MPVPSYHSGGRGVDLTCWGYSQLEGYSFDILQMPLKKKHTVKFIKPGTDLIVKYIF